MVPVPMHGGLSWQAYNEETASDADSSFTMVGLLEQINTTRDATDYLWYTTEYVVHSSTPSSVFLLPVLFLSNVLCVMFPSPALRLTPVKDS